MQLKSIAKFCAIALAVTLLSPTSAGAAGTKLDNGRNWFLLPNAVSGGGGYGVAVSGDGVYLYATDVGGVRTSTDAGLNWRDANTNLDLSLNIADIATNNTGQYVVVVQNGGVIQTSNNYGDSWVTRTAPYGAYRVAMSSSGQYIAALNPNLGVYWSSNFGVSFSVRVFAAGSGQITRIAMSGDGSKILLPDHQNEKLYLATGLTASFVRVPGLASMSFGPVAISGDGNTMLSAINGGEIWVSRDGGSNWYESQVVKEIPDDHNYTAATISYDGSRIGIARGGAYLMTSSDSGFNWEARPGSGRTGWSGISATQDGLTMYANMSGEEIWKSLPSYIWFDSGTVTLLLPTCNAETGTVTSIAAGSVELVIDTMTAAANSDGATYIYFTETDTALWGATYAYGQYRNPICQYENLEGEVLITRGRFISSVPAFSETTTNTTDFVQYVGNIQDEAMTATEFRGDPCGNLSVPHAANVTRSCTPGILADFDQFTTATTILWRTQSFPLGVKGQRSASAWTLVKVKRSAVRGAPIGTTFAATETFTLISV